jgi:hypothetical protein
LSLAHTTDGNACRYRKWMLFAGLFAGIVVSAPGAEADPTSGASGKTPTATTAARAVVVPRSERAEMFYARRFGVDHLQVRSTASGNSLQFRYRVVDAEKAKVLNDKRATPYMLDWQTGNRLLVPTMEKIGTLRQMATPEVGREYWMVFSNPGKLVKPGQKVDVVVGAIRLEGLTVE